MPPSSTSWEDRLRDHLETSWPKSLADAFNARDFNPESPPWTLLAPGFQAGPFPPEAAKAMNAARFMKFLTEECKRDPWTMNVLDSTSHIVEDTVIVFTNFEKKYQEIVRQCTFFTEFKIFNGQWLAMTIRGFAGGYV